MKELWNVDLQPAEIKTTFLRTDLIFDLVLALFLSLSILVRKFII